MDKTPLLAEVRGWLEATRRDLAREADAARAGTRVDGTHRPENRGERAAVTSQGYLTGALQARLAEVDESLRRLALVAPGPRTRAAVGAVVEVVDDDDTTRTFFVVPGGGGRALDSARSVVALSPTSPVGRALHGAVEGDVVIAVLAGAERELEVLSVR